MEMKFYRCSVCGQIVAIVKGTDVPVICCGKPMEELVPGVIDASLEKHVPVFESKDNTVHVTVGSTEHPMTDDHYIEWIAIQTKHGNQCKELKPGDKPKACFALTDDDKVLAVYAFCNIHDLWKS